MRIGRFQFDGLVAITVLGLSLLTVGLLFALRGVLVKAPGAVFPVIMLVLFGGVFVVAWVAKRGRAR